MTTTLSPTLPKFKIEEIIDDRAHYRMNPEKSTIDATSVDEVYELMELLCACSVAEDRGDFHALISHIHRLEDLGLYSLAETYKGMFPGMYGCDHCEGLVEFEVDYGEGDVQLLKCPDCYPFH